MIMKKKSFSKCFISAPASLNIDALISSLESKGILAFDAYAIGHDADFPPSVEEEIKDSDFLVAVFSPNTPNANVLYEIGFARGAKKPIFLVVQDEGAIPRFLKDTVYVRASLDDRQLISFYLDQFLSKHKKGVKKRIPRLKKPSMGLDRSYLEEQLKGIREKGTEMELLHLVRDLFRSQGFVVDTSHGTGDKGADMSIWVDSLESSFGNPILIEIRMGRLSERVLERIEAQMRHYLSRTNARSGLLIYFDRQGRRFNRSKLQLPLVIRLNMYDLVEKLAEHPIDRVLLRERNLVAHGG